MQNKIDRGLLDFLIIIKEVRSVKNINLKHYI